MGDVDKMTEERNDLRFQHIETDVVDLKSTDREQAKNIVAIEKGNIKQEIFVEDIFKKIIVLEGITNKSLAISTKTQALALDLKKDSDKQKDNTKWSTRFWKTAAYSNGIVFAIWLLKQLIKWAEQ